MANIQIKDANGDIKYLKTIGTGTDNDPYSPVQDVNVQDATNKIKTLPFRNLIVETTLTSDSVVDSRQISVTSAAGMSIGNHLTLHDDTNGKRFDATIIDIVGTDIELDTPMCKIFTTADTVVAVSTIGLNVDGDTTPVSFNLRSGTASSPNTFHVTRLMINMLTTTLPIYSDFGDIDSGLTKGIVLRLKDGTYYNMFNFKSNFDIASAGYDLEIMDAGGPQGLNGIRSRITFSGQEKMGAVVQLLPGEDLEITVQDDLSSLVQFEVYAQGHIAD